MDVSRQPYDPVCRRRILLAGAGSVVVGTVLASCGAEDGRPAPDPGDPYGAAEPSDGPTDGATAPPLEEEREGLVALDEVPVGGAVVVEDEGRPVVVAQPKAGEVVAFSAVCTHRGCTVGVQERILRCPCHGSTFDPATGDNTGGPAPEPLPEVAVRVEDGMVLRA